MREKEYMRWLVDRGNILLNSAKCYKNYIKKVEEIIGMDIEDIYIEYKKRDKETDPFEVLIKEIKTSPEYTKKIKYMNRMKLGSAIRRYKQFYHEQ